MIVDLVICAVIVAVIIAYPSRAAIIAALQHISLWFIVHLYLTGSPYWNIGFLDEYHLFCALFNTVFTILVCMFAGRARLAVIGSALLILLNMAMYFIVRDAVDVFARQAIGAFAYFRLIFVALQITGLIHYASGNNRQNGKRSRARSVVGAGVRRGSDFAILSTKIHQRA